MQDITIRNAVKEDLLQCEKLGQIEEFKLASGGWLDAKFLENYISPDYFLVAENNNQIIGYLIGEPLKGNGVMLCFLVVKENMRKKGIGKKLLKEFEKRCRENGAEWILLYAPTFNEGTVMFYKKRGYNQGKSFFEFNKKL